MTGTLVVLSVIARSVTNKTLATSFSADSGGQLALRLALPGGCMRLRVPSALPHALRLRLHDCFWRLL